jgi:hypothetical protein
MGEPERMNDMSEDEIKSLFRTVADHLESLAISIQNVEEVQEQDRARQEADRLRMEADHARLDRLERLFKLMVRLGDRERKELRERINALIDAHIRGEAQVERLSLKMEELSEAQKQSMAAFAQFQAQIAETQAKADQRMTRMEEANARFQAQIAETQAKADQRMTRMEEANARFQAQIGTALSKLAEATALAHQRLDAQESPG